MDEDGNIDIWLGGNFYALKPQVGRHDASRSVFLRGSADKPPSFKPAYHKSLIVPGEIRDIVPIYAVKAKRFIVARNNDKVLVFQKKK